MKSWITPKAKKGLKSKIHGRGLFAIKPIKKGEVVAIKGGHLVSGARLKKLKVRKHCEMQVGDNLYLAPLTEKEFNDSMLMMNHSCDPNTGFKDEVTIIAMRNIKPGEEITIDYGMCDDNDNHRMKCNCRTKYCRKIIRGKDWQRPDLQKRYSVYFSLFIRKKIDKIKSAK